MEAKPAPTPEELRHEGRFLYANDDDWDWASPAQAAKKCGLSTFGEMRWSALDWMEEGLPDVRGLIVGTLPEEYLKLEDLHELRRIGTDRVYRVEPHEPGTLARRLAAKPAPNLVLMMRNRCTEPEPSFPPEDLEALLAFVRQGGRLMVMDDWGVYRPVLEHILKNPLAPPKAEPAEEVRKKVEARIAELGNEDFATREAATRALIELGPAALPFLPSDAAEAEVRERLVRIRKVWEPDGAKPGGKGLSDPDMGLLYLRAKAGYSGAELRDTLVNAQQEPGKALLLRIPPAKGPGGAGKSTDTPAKE